MRDLKRVDLQYQLRKCLLYLNKSYIAASNCGEHETMRELKKCMDLIKRQLKVLSTEKKD